ncbi:MAG: anti-sigma factor family protein, partial [Longimicrobiales bacterium]
MSCGSTCRTARFAGMRMDMTCRDAAASFDDFVDERLPPVMRRALSTHLRECRSCTRVLNDLRCTRRLLRRLPHENMPDPMKHRLLDKLRRSRTPDPARPAPRSHNSTHSQRPSVP